MPLQRNSSFRLSEKKRPLDPVQSFRNNKRTEGEAPIHARTGTGELALEWGNWYFFSGTGTRLGNWT